MLLVSSDEETMVQKGLSLPKVPQLVSGKAGFKASQPGSEAILLVTSQYCLLCWAKLISATKKACIETEIMAIIY